MDNKKRIKLYTQLIVGIFAIVLGCFTCAYGYNFFVGKIEGSIFVCLILLGLCILSITTCVVLTVKNFRDIKKDKE